MHRGVPDDAALADLAASCLELRLHEGDDVAGGRRGAAATTGRMSRREMNDTSMVTMSNGARAGGRSARVSVRAFMRSITIDARIAAKLPIELAVADVERDDARRAALQQHVGEPARRSADVEGRASLDGNAERVERMRKLDPAAADVRMIGPATRHVCIGEPRASPLW